MSEIKCSDAVIDEQHDIISKYFYKIRSKISEDFSEDELVILFGRFVEYYHVHSLLEELLMARAGHSYLDLHANEHVVLLGEARHLLAGLETWTLAETRLALDDLEVRFLHHIKTSDLVFLASLDGHGESGAAIPADHAVV